MIVGFENLKRNYDIHISEITLLHDYVVVANQAAVRELNEEGLILTIKRENITVADLRNNLNLDSIIGEQVAFYIPSMDLDLDGEVFETKHMGNGVFEVIVKFSEEAPEYWRQCVADLMPR